MNKGYIITVYESTNDENALKDYALSAKKVIEKFDGKINAQIKITGPNMGKNEFLNECNLSLK